MENEWIVLNREEIKIAIKNKRIWNHTWQYMSPKRYEMNNKYYFHFFTKLGKLFYS